jgi:hypothetical protein
MAQLASVKPLDLLDVFSKLQDFQMEQKSVDVRQMFKKIEDATYVADIVGLIKELSSTICFLYEYSSDTHG